MLDLGLPLTIQNGAGSKEKELSFDGVNQYVDLNTDWVPTSAMYEYQITFSTPNAASGSLQRLMDGNTATGSHNCRISAAGVLGAVYRDTAGAFQFISGFGVTDNEVTTVTVSYYPDRVELTQGGVTAVNNNSPELAELSTFATTVAASSEFFNGTIYDVKIQDHAGIQNRNVTNGNPANQLRGDFNKIDLQSDFDIQFDFSTTATTGFPTILSGESDGDEIWIYVDGSTGKLLVRLGGSTFLGTTQAGLNSGAIHRGRVTRSSGIVSISVDELPATTIAYSPTVSPDMIYARDSFGLWDGYAANLRIVDNGTVVMDARMDEEGDVFENSAEELGANLWGDDPVTETGWSNNGDGTYSCDGSQSSSTNLFFDLTANISSGDIVTVVFRIIDRSAGAVQALVNGAQGDSEAAEDEYKAYVVAGNDAKTGLRASVSFVGRVEVLSVSVSPDILLINKTPSDNEFIPNNSRWYPLNEGTGDVVYDQKGGEVRNVTNGNPTNQLYGLSNDVELSGDFDIEFQYTSTETLSSKNAFALTGTSLDESISLTQNFPGNPNVLKIETNGYTPGSGTIVTNTGVVHDIKFSRRGNDLLLFVDGVLDYQATHTAPNLLDGYKTPYVYGWRKPNTAPAIAGLQDCVVANLKITDKSGVADVVLMDAAMDETGDVFRNKAQELGPDLWDDGSAITTGTGWSYEGEGVWLHTGTAQGEVRIPSPSWVEGEIISASVEVLESGAATLQLGGPTINGNKITQVGDGIASGVLQAESIGVNNSIRLISSGDGVRARVLMVRSNPNIKLFNKVSGDNEVRQLGNTFGTIQNFNENQWS